MFSPILPTRLLLQRRCERPTLSLRGFFALLLISFSSSLWGVAFIPDLLFHLSIFIPQPPPPPLPFLFHLLSRTQLVSPLPSTGTKSPPRLLLQQFPLDSPRLDAHKHDHDNTNQQTRRHQSHIHRNRISVERLMQKIIQSALAEIQEARKTDDSPVYRSKRPKPKDLGTVIGNSGVVKRAVQNKKADVGVGC